MMARRKQVTMTITVSVPDWLTATDARREVRAVLQGYTGHKSLFFVGGGERHLDDFGTGNGIRVRRVGP
jgi:hypothetical protein